MLVRQREGESESEQTSSDDDSDVDSEDEYAEDQSARGSSANLDGNEEQPPKKKRRTTEESAVETKLQKTKPTLAQARAAEATKAETTTKTVDRRDQRETLDVNDRKRKWSKHYAVVREKMGNVEPGELLSGLSSLLHAETYSHSP
jgi:hypothetical protein